MRIILRTGQPGLSPEKDVILNYDINDYKEKTELSAIKLFSSLVTAIRSYRDLSIIEQNKIGLKKNFVKNLMMPFLGNILFQSSIR